MRLQVTPILVMCIRRVVIQIVTVNTMEKGYRCELNRYDLKDSRHIKSMHIGILLCSLIAADSMCSSISLTGIRHDGTALRADADDACDSLKISRIFSREGICGWHMECRIHESMVYMYGPCYGTMVQVSVHNGFDGWKDVEQVLKRAECLTKQYA